MLFDTQSVSPWYVIHRGFRLTESCRNCANKLTHYKAFDKNSAGILSRCESCGKEIVRMKSTVHNKAPFYGDSPVNDEIFGRIREGSCVVERFNGSVVELLHT